MKIEDLEIGSTYTMRKGSRRVIEGAVAICGDKPVPLSGKCDVLWKRPAGDTTRPTHGRCWVHSFLSNAVSKEPAV